MQFSYETKRLNLMILSADNAPLIQHFYQKNAAFLEPFEPARPENFYTIAFHRSNLSCEYRAFLRLTHIRFWLFRKDAPEEPIGSICFSNIMHGAFKKCIIGYKLGEEFCHYGYMQEAISFLIPIVMKELDLHRVEAYVQPDNMPSIRLLEKLHFVEEGYLQKYAEIHGNWTDHLLFSYLRADSLPRF